MSQNQTTPIGNGTHQINTTIFPTARLRSVPVERIDHNKVHERFMPAIL